MYDKPNQKYKNKYNRKKNKCVDPESTVHHLSLSVCNFVLATTGLKTNGPSKVTISFTFKFFPRIPMHNAIGTESICLMLSAALLLRGLI